MDRLLKFLSIGLLFVGVSTSICYAQQTVKLVNDPIQSSLTFTAYVRGGIPVKGVFHAFATVAEFDRSQRVNTFKASVDTNSVDTKNKIRDRHLRSKTFFNTVAYPDIFFSVTAPFSLESNVIEGVLTVFGKQYPVRVPVDMAFLQNTETKQYVLSVKGQHKISRKQLGLNAHRLFIRDAVDVQYDLVLKLLPK